MTPGPSRLTDADQPLPGARSALALLLCINLFNYIDRQILSAVLPRLQLDGTLFSPTDTDLQFKLGLLTSAFLVSYMIFSPIVGWLDGHGYRRWVILGTGVSLWSIASGCSGFATGYGLLLLTRCLVGVGEGAYGPVASALLADAYPPRRRGFVMAAFNLAIPVGSALGFVIGGVIADLADDWRPAFWVTFSGALLGVVCFLRKELPRPTTAAQQAAAPNYFAVLKGLSRNRSFVYCCAGMTAVTFVLGGLAAWVPAYVFDREARFALTPAVLEKLARPKEGETRRPMPEPILAALRPVADGEERTQRELKAHVRPVLSDDDMTLHYEAIAVQSATETSMKLSEITPVFGGIVVLGGLTATVFGAWAGERLRTKGVRGAYFWVIGLGALLSVPALVGFLYAPFPLAWVFVYVAVFGLFLHTGPAFTALANVVTSEVRATAFAINILVIHALGDVISPPLIGLVADYADLQTAFLGVSAFGVLGGVLWLIGVRYLDDDTARATG